MTFHYNEVVIDNSHFRCPVPGKRVLKNLGVSAASIKHDINGSVCVYLVYCARVGRFRSFKGSCFPMAGNTISDTEHFQCPDRWLRVLTSPVIKLDINGTTHSKFKSR